MLVEPNQIECCVPLCCLELRKHLHHGWGTDAVTQVARRKFRDDEQVHGDATSGEFALERRHCRVEAVNPDGSVREDHRSSTRSREIGCNSGMEPPRAASRRPASRSISALGASPARAVFSVIEVYSPAVRSRSSSRAGVVLIVSRCT